MQRLHSGVACAVLGLGFMAGPAWAQRSNGTLVGYVKDPVGLPLPGATITATSPQLISERTAVTDTAGYFRLINLPPGRYAVTGQLGGFALIQQLDVQVRAGATFRLNLTMQMGSLQESVTVTAETPMLDMDTPGQVFNIDGDFQRAVPVQGRANWSDFLELTPGVNARPFDDGSGRMVYFGHGTEHFAHVVQLDGANAAGYRDPQLTYIQMDSDMLEDIEVKSGGVEAASPLGTGLVMNIVTKSGGNDLRGSVGYQFQPLGWNGDNSPAGETPTTQKIGQLNLSIGGPIVRDRLWFFASGRYAKNEASISRVAAEVERLEQFVPGFEPFNNVFEGFFPYAKITAQLGRKHMFTAAYQRDSADISSSREYHTFNQELRTSGGALYSARLNSLLSNNLSTELLISYNDKTSVFQDFSQWESFGMLGTPQIDVHETCRVSGGRCRGTGRILQDGAGDGGTVTTGPGHVLVIRGDLTYFKQGWAGSHEFKTGVYLAPSLHRESVTNYINDGFFFEERRLVDPNDLSAGTIPYRRRFAEPNELLSNDMTDRDLAFYVQDTWRPTNRVTINAGVRVDFVRRFDNIFQFERMNDTTIGPRFGFAWALDGSGTTILRGSLGRVHEQVGGRDFASSAGAGNRVQITDRYDNDGDGVFETTFVSRASAPELAQFEFSPDLHQPYTDEAILGLRRQFPGGFTVDAAYVHREVKHRYGEVDVNGIYPDGPNQPFGGFGLLDPDQGRMMQQTNNTWDKLVYDAVEVTLTKRMSSNWSAMLSVNKQWQHLSGTWNPTDPARFIQPEAYDNDKCLWMPRGNQDDNSYQLGTNSTYCPTWRPYSIRAGFMWQAPAGLIVNGSLTVQAGPYSGPILTRIAVADPVFGPDVVVSSTGNRESNPLGDTVRFRDTPRGAGTQNLPAIKTVNLRLGKRFNLGGVRELELAANIFNVFNSSDFHQYTYNGANQDFNPSFLVGRSRQAARAVQMLASLRF